MKKTLLILSILLAGVCSHAQTWNIGTPNAADMKAMLSNDTLYIQGTGTMGNVRTTCNGCVVNTPWFPAYTSQIKYAVVEEGVVNISMYCFYGLNALTSVTIPKSVISISRIFDWDTPSVASIVNHNPVPQNINVNTFVGINLAACTLTVPCGSLTAYQNAPVWQDFGTIEEYCPPQAGISNVQANFSCPGQVTVTYDLGTTNPTDVTLYYSHDGGKTWLTAQTVTGDLTAQSSGTGKSIVWDNRADKVRWGKFRLKVEIPKVPELECVEIAGVCWAKYNVDAPGTFTNNPEDAGMFYQWNRIVGWSVTNPLVASDGSSWNSSWTGGSATEWEAVNNPCPNGFRVPTETEIQSLVLAPNQWETNPAGRTFVGDNGDTIFLPIAGYRIALGTLNSPNGGFYWGSTISIGSGGAASLKFDNTKAERTFFTKNCGKLVRCVRK
ncbi:MAG: leucine-rich repeat domain-containing protein [Prevotellaceae bacterium]|jgi:hypothetical protein|nr:leucine-rich repeat domain-containing protein [Prevotellaceae bacterium]